jgi:hypothetical protein
MRPASFSSNRLYLADPADARFPRRTTARKRVAAFLSNPEFLVLVIICGVGLLATAFLTVVAPGFTASFTSLQQFL